MEITEQDFAELIRQRDELIACLGRAHEYVRAMKLMNVGLYIQIAEGSSLSKDCIAAGRHIGEAADWLERIHAEARRRYQGQQDEPAPVSEPAQTETRILH